MDASRKRRLTWLQKRLDYRFKRPGLLETALVHRSFINEPGGSDLANNERLEFLGDAVLELVVTHILYAACEDQQEGELSKMRARAVNGRSLAAAARGIGLDRYVALSRGEEATGGRRKESILSGAYEALIGALFLDGGMRPARRRVAADLAPVIEEILAGSDIYRDYKTRLQEVSQKRFGAIPIYRIAGQRGPDHAKIFDVEVLIKGAPHGRASGPSKKEAQQRAARIALAKLGAGFEPGCEK